MFSRLDTIPRRVTNRQTLHDSKDRAMQRRAGNNVACWLHSKASLHNSEQVADPLMCTEAGQLILSLARREMNSSLPTCSG